MNPHPWPIRKWFLDHQSHPWPTEAELDELAASSSRTRQLVQRYLSQLRIGNIDPHSKHGGKESYVIWEWFRNNLHEPYPDEAQIQTLVSASGLSQEEVKARVAYLRVHVKPPASDSRMPQELGETTTELRSLPRRSPDESRKEKGPLWPRRPRQFKTARSYVEATQSQEEIETSRRKYQCTACLSSFDYYSLWENHERGVHGYRTTEWICMADGMPDAGSICDFCCEQIESADHLERHNASKCLARPIGGRTYPDERALKSHIQVYHMKNASKEEKRMVKVPPTWERPLAHINPLALWCGFCQMDLKSVEARMEHVGEHFKAGKTMADWVHRPSPNN